MPPRKLSQRKRRKRKAEENHFVKEEGWVKDEIKDEEGWVKDEKDDEGWVKDEMDQKDADAETPFQSAALISSTDRHSFRIVGVTHYQRALRKLPASSTVIMERDPDNAYDVHAVGIKTLGGDQLGHIGRHDNVTERGNSTFWCPRLLGTAYINSFTKGYQNPELFYGTVEGHAMAASLAPGSLAALPLEVPMNLIETCRTLSERLDAASPMDERWLRLKIRLLGKARAASLRAEKKRGGPAGDEESIAPRCMMSGLPCETIEPIWRFEKGAKRVVLENWVLCHRAMRRVLYVNEEEPEVEAVDRLVRLNRSLLTEGEARALYRRTLQTCRTRGEEGWTLGTTPANGFCLANLHFIERLL